MKKRIKSSLFALYDKEILKCRYAAGFTDLIKRFLLTETGLRLCPVRQKAGRGEKSRCRGAKKQFCLNKNGESIRVRQRRRGEIPSPVLKAVKFVLHRIGTNRPRSVLFFIKTDRLSVYGATLYPRPEKRLVSLIVNSISLLKTTETRWQQRSAATAVK